MPKLGTAFGILPIVLVSFVLAVPELFGAATDTGTASSHATAAPATSQNPAPDPNPAKVGTLVIKTPDFDFGTVRSGTAVEHDYVVENNGTAAVRISQVRSSCGCTVVQASKEDIPPGGKSSVHVRFDTTGRNGRQHKSIYVQTTDPLQSLLICQITGDITGTRPVTGNPVPAASGTPVIVASSSSKTVPASSAMKSPVVYDGPRLSITETQHDFGRVRQGSRPEHPFLCRNTGKGRLILSQVRASADWVEAIIRPVELIAGKEGRVWVKVNTAKQVGKQSGTVTLATNDPQVPELVLSVTVEIDAKGSVKP